MSHVCTALGFLVLLLSAWNTESSCLLSKRLEANKTESDKKTSVTRVTSVRKHRVTMAQLRQEAFLDKSIEDSWGYLNEFEEYKNFFTRDEISAADDLFRLGIRILVKRISEGTLMIRYRGTVTVGAQAPRIDNESFDEYYVCKNVFGMVAENSDTVWSVLKENSLEHSVKMLIGFINQNKLLSSVLMLKSQPGVAELLPTDVYSEYIFAVNNMQNVLKYFIFQNCTRNFMYRFLQVYKTDANNRIDALSKVLTDLKVSDEKVQEAFNFAVEYEDCPVPVLAAFVTSRRPLSIDPSDLERIVLSGKENAKDRVSLLKLSTDPNFIEKIITKCFTSGSYSLLIREILFDRRLVSLVSSEFTKKWFYNFVVYDRVKAIKFILSTEMMIKVKAEIPEFGTILAKSIDYVTLDSFETLVKGKMIKTRVPIFSSQDIRKAAYLLIKKNAKPEFLEFLLSERYIAPNQKITFETGESFTLLAVAVKEDNLAFIKLLNKINWSRCEDVYDIGTISDEMRSLLISKGADFNREKISSSPSESGSGPIERTTTATTSNVSPVALLSTPLKRPSDSVELVTNETTFETPEIKRPKRATYSEIPQDYYKNALEALDEDCMCTILLTCNEEFKRSYGYNEIIWDLYNAQMIRSLNQILDGIPVDLMEKIVKEFADQECEYVICYLISRGHFNLESDWFDGKNLIAYLLKNRKANFALNLIDKFRFDLRSSKEDASNNPEGDIILNAVWNFDLLERLLELGASPNVKVNYQKLNRVVTLKEYAHLTNRSKLFLILEKYHAK